MKKKKKKISSIEALKVWSKIFSFNIGQRVCVKGKIFYEGRYGTVVDIQKINRHEEGRRVIKSLFIVRLDGCRYNYYIYEENLRPVRPYNRREVK